MSRTLPILKLVDSFTVTGLSLRTRNSDEFNPQTAKLPKLWESFYSRNPSLNAAVFSVYSGYASDAQGSYEVTLGTADASQALELRSITILAGDYLVFHGKGAMPETVIATWQRIWEYFGEDGSYQRSFMTDFEAYTHANEVAIYIGLLS